MCGACGAGRAVPRWEDQLGRPTRTALRLRAGAANRLLTGTGLRVRPWFSTGYLLSDSVGRTAHAADLDSLWRAAWGWGAHLAGWQPGPGGDGAAALALPQPWDRDATAVWLAAVAPAAVLDVRLPDPAAGTTVIARTGQGTVLVSITALTPGSGDTASVRGDDAAQAARHLEGHLLGPGANLTGGPQDVRSTGGFA